MSTLTTNSLQSKFCSVALGIALALLLIPNTVVAAPDSVTPVEGNPVLMLSGFDLGQVGYQKEEFFISGTATSYKLSKPATPDGNWSATSADTSPFATRIVVARPTDGAKFNGTVLVEWLNVTAGRDAPATWMVTHREILRRGYAYVAVSAQKVGIEGGPTPMGMGAGLKKTNPDRYGSLSHPGDAFAFDIFSQVGTALKAPNASDLLGGLTPNNVLALGESQSAAFLTTYVNAVDPLTKVFDGFFIHSRFGSGAALDGSGMARGAGAIPPNVQFRTDLRVPVFALITETDLLGGGLSGYHGSRRPDDDRLRVWEVAGTAHADNYLFMGASIDSGLQPNSKLASVFVPTANIMGQKLKKPANPGMAHHYVAQAALASLENWIRTGKPPASTPTLELASGGTTTKLTLDDNGLALGGIRTPWVDVPTMQLSGVGNSGGFIAILAGVGDPFDQATLTKLYPGGKADYLKRFEASLDTAIKSKHIVPEDRQEILDIAALNFDATP